MVSLKKLKNLGTIPPAMKDVPVGVNSVTGAVRFTIICWLDELDAEGRGVAGR